MCRMSLNYYIETVEFYRSNELQLNPSIKTVVFGKNTYNKVRNINKTSFYKKDQLQINIVFEEQYNSTLGNRINLARNSAALFISNL